jgi:curved DNA-binding protein CbpA
MLRKKQVDAAGAKSAYRKLARFVHPDKVGEEAKEAANCTKIHEL